MTTDNYSISPARLATAIMKKWLTDNWWMIAIVPAISLMLALMGDLRFLFVALIAIFVVIPPIIFIIYFYYGMTPVARYSILPHHIKADASGLHIIYIAEDDDVKPRPEEHIKMDDIDDMKTDGINIYVHLKQPRYALVIIPVNALTITCGETKNAQNHTFGQEIAHKWIEFYRKNAQSLA